MATMHYSVRSNSKHCLMFWNYTIFAHITEKYMEFDLNDKGEIGRAAVFQQH